MNRNTKATIALLVPPVCLVGGVAAYSIASFILTATTTSESAVLIGYIVRMSLGVVGLVGILGIFVLWPYGFYLLLTDEKKKSEPST